MFPDIRKLPLEVLAWERIEFRRGVGFGVEIQVSLPIIITELERGVANAAAILSEIQNFRQKVNFRVLSDGFGETCNPTVRCESFQFLHRPLKFT